MDIKLIVNITSRAWSLPILACLSEGTPGRQAPLLKATGATRTAFAQSLDHLTKLGLLERNPGHGHPLRPEFRLTPKGAEVAFLAQKIDRLAEASDKQLLRKAWTLPVLTSLKEPRYFGDIRRTLDPITDRALSQSLRTMEDRSWVHRAVDASARPPRPIYSSINLGQKISGIAGPMIGF